MLALAGIALASFSCGPNQESIPIEVMAERTVETFDGRRIQAREFSVLEPIVVDTGIQARHGIFRFEAQFTSEVDAQGGVTVRVDGTDLQSCPLASGVGWLEFAVEIPDNLPVTTIELAIEVAGRYGLASLELAESDADSGTG